MHDHPTDRAREIPADARVILDDFSIEVTIPRSQHDPAGRDALLRAVAREVTAWLPSLQRAVQVRHPHVEVQVSHLTPLVYGDAE
jgi:hypothetical protein